MALVAAGLSDKRIGARLGIAPHTASNYVGVILQKLHANNRTEAAMIAARQGIVELAPPGALDDLSG